MTSPPFLSFWFDCDSTLSSIEGVDELCRWRDEHARAEIESLTTRAMEGEISLEEIYPTRLELLAPHRTEIDKIGQLYVEQMLPWTKEVVAALHHLGKTVGIVSGGIEQAVRVLAAEIGIGNDLVHAVPLIFNEDGSYQGFNQRSPLWKNGGKLTVMRNSSQRPAIFIGDGVTDLETRPAVDLLVGFGGVRARTAVREGADIFLDRPDLRCLLDIALDDDEKGALGDDPRFAPLLLDD